MKRPILYVLAPFALGIIFSSVYKIPPPHSFFLSIIFFVIAILFSKKNLFSHAALYIAVFLLGGLYYQNSIILPGSHISRLAADKPVKISIRGTITDDPVVSLTRYKKPKTTFTLKADFVKESETWRSSTGLVSVNMYARTEEPLRFGQNISIEGMISKPIGLKNPGLFNYPKYLAMKDIYAVFKVRENDAVEMMKLRAVSPIKDAAYRLRGWMRRAIDEQFDAPYSGFIKAIMIGDRAGLEYSLNDDFVKTGTVHAIAISGLNVGLIAAMFLFMLALFRLPKKINLIFVACVMALYTFVAGGSPPIVRAVIIFIVLAMGYIINRESEPLNSLAFAAFAMLLVNPKEIFDPSFQLSFVSIAGLIIFTPRINSILRVDAINRNSFYGKSSVYLLSAVSVSLAAWLGTWPIVAKYFNIVSPVALLANLIVVPALFLLTAATFLFLLTVLFSGFLAGTLACALTFICESLFKANHILASLPFAYVRIPAPSCEFMFIYYAALLLMIFPPRIELGKFSVRRIEILILLVLFAGVLVWRSVLTADSGRLSITIMDVGQGDCALLELPGGKNVLIDAGPGGDGERFDAARSVVAPSLWNKNINALDAVVVTHFHEDHLGGIIYVLENFKVGQVIDNGAICEGSEIFNKYLRTIKTKNIRRETMGRGDRISFQGGKIFVLNPEKAGEVADCNENSLVLKLQYKKFSALFCGDASAFALTGMVNKYGESLRSDIIKIPHHGGYVGDEIVVKNFLGAVRARAAMISVAKMNMYGMPSQKTLKILTALKSRTYETKDNGAIMILTDGTGYEISGCEN